MARKALLLAVVFAALSVLFAPSFALAQATEPPGGATELVTNGGASTGTMLAAALETVGYHSQAQILDQLSEYLAALGALVFLCVILSAILSFAVSGGSYRTVWLLIGPPLFMYLSGVELNGYKNRTDAAGVEWAFGAFKDTENRRDQVLQPVQLGAKANVSFVFHKYNEFVSEAVQRLVAVITDRSMVPQMLFMARQQMLDDVFAFDVNDPHWQSLMGYFMVHCASEINYAMMVALGANDPVFRDTPDYQTAREQYCDRWPRKNKPFTAGPWQKFAYEKKFWQHENITPDEHFTKLQEGTGLVSCAEMWSWSVAGGRAAIKVQAENSLRKNLEPYAFRNVLTDTGASVPQSVLDDVNEKLTPQQKEANAIISDPCPQVHQPDGTNFIAVVNPGANGQGGLNFGDIEAMFSHHVLRKQLTRGPSEEMMYQASEYSGIRVSDSSKTKSNPNSAAAVQRRMKQHEFSEARKFEAYALIMIMPYVQGILLYMFAVLYPFFALVVMLPGKAGSFFTWLTLWAWVKSWDVGWAVVMVADQILWELFPKTAFYNKDAAALYASPIGLLEGLFVADPSYNTSMYWLLLGTMIAAVPVVTAHSMIGAKRVFGDMLSRGLSDIVQRYSGSSSGSGGYQSYVAMENTGNVLFEREHNRIGNFNRNFVGPARAVNDVQASLDKKYNGLVPASVNAAATSAEGAWNKLTAIATGTEAEAQATLATFSAGTDPTSNMSQLPSHVQNSFAASGAAGQALVQNAKLTAGTVAAHAALALPHDPKSPVDGHQALLMRIGGIQVDDDKTTRANVARFFDQMVANGVADVDPEQRQVASLYSGDGAAIPDLTSELLRTQVEGAGLKSAGDVMGALSFMSGVGLSGYDAGAETRAAGIRLKRLAHYQAAEGLQRTARFLYYASYFDQDVQDGKSMQTAVSGRHQWFLDGATPFETQAELNALSAEYLRQVEDIRGQLHGGALRHGLEAGSKLLRGK